MSEFDTSNVIAEETDDCQPMGDDSTEVTEEMSDKADEKRCEAQAKFADGDYEGAVALFTESIEANPTRAVCFAKRAAYVRSALCDFLVVTLNSVNPHRPFVTAIRQSS